jgi:hypothetical protein
VRKVDVHCELSIHANCPFTFDKLILIRRSASGIIGKIDGLAVIIGYCNDNVVYSACTVW